MRGNFATKVKINISSMSAKAPMASEVASSRRKAININFKKMWFTGWR